jgi:hypothetical protein
MGRHPSIHPSIITSPTTQQPPNSLNQPSPPKPNTTQAAQTTTVQADLAPRGKLVFATGLAGLLSVPVFKAMTGLPPYLGMLSALGVMWVLTDTIHAGECVGLERRQAGSGCVVVVFWT